MRTCCCFVVFILGAFVSIDAASLGDHLMEIAGLHPDAEGVAVLAVSRQRIACLLSPIAPHGRLIAGSLAVDERDRTGESAAGGHP